MVKYIRITYYLSKLNSSIIIQRMYITYLPIELFYYELRIYKYFSARKLLIVLIKLFLDSERSEKYTDFTIMCLIIDLINKN